MTALKIPVEGVVAVAVEAAVAAVAVEAGAKSSDFGYP